MFRSHRGISRAHGAQIDINGSCSIPLKQSLELMSGESGGRENLGFIRDDLKNYLRTKRSRVMMQGDTGGLLEYLQRMQLDDPNFFYAIQASYFLDMDKPSKSPELQLEEWRNFGDHVCRKLANMEVSTPSGKGRKPRRKKITVLRSHAMASKASKQLPFPQSQ
ncbi:hypothetical protein ACH5RR_029423 [Cinchona calisaya]|uniref:Uncharacterized protein n=1 Tax=Cinchona calisaya TaxID=153742 RepID=A0ABD2YUX3_9GENT